MVEIHRSHKAVLEFLQNKSGQEIVATPRVIEANTDFQISSIRSGVRELEEWGLIEYHDEKRGLYKLSDTGRAFIEGDLDASQLESE